MKIAEGIEMLEINAILEDGPTKIYPVIIKDIEGVILIDTGLPGQLSNLSDAIQKAGFNLDQISSIIITNHDIHHIGNLSSILAVSKQNIQIIAHEREKPYISGEFDPLKLFKLKEILNSTHGEKHNMFENIFEKFRDGYSTLKATVNKTVSDDQNLANLGGITVIYTPGHTLGHISLYLNEFKMLIAGDLLHIENNELIPLPERHIFDKYSTERSLKKLTLFDIEAVICYHGGYYNLNVNDRIREICEIYKENDV